MLLFVASLSAVIHASKSVSSYGFLHITYYAGVQPEASTAEAVLNCVADFDTKAPHCLASVNLNFCLAAASSTRTRALPDGTDQLCLSMNTVTDALYAQSCCLGNGAICL